MSLGFPLAPGRMVPADAVLGKLDNATGVVKVRCSSSSSSSGGGGSSSGSGGSTGDSIMLLELSR